jgi:ATP-dependent helicase IRC3
MMHVMATGTGKTIVIGKLFEKLRSRLPGQMVVLAHTEKLVEQNADKTQKVNPHLKVGIDMGASYYADTDSDIISASIATLGRDGSKRVERFNWNSIDKLIADEAHHSTGDSYRRVFDAFGSFVPDTHKLTLGFTATPNRPDGVPLSDVYQKVGFVYAIRQAIKDGWLVQPRGYRVKTSTSLAGVSVVKGDYNKTELSAAVDSKPRNEQIVDMWMKRVREPLDPRVLR